VELLNLFGDKTEMQKESHSRAVKLFCFVNSLLRVMMKYLPQGYFFLVTKMRCLQKTRCQRQKLEQADSLNLSGSSRDLHEFKSMVAIELLAHV